eukprot:TRINITY_DN738_c2_g1_i1.p1 TRINITY_DN738_c2_g1~~TRINITY_DN738_c2_g1_i1.p1  ORF type:complete len:119 (-),score=18.32 TRINITY_DN738_c2_g1_i1:142-498(-)
MFISMDYMAGTVIYDTFIKTKMAIVFSDIYGYSNLKDILSLLFVIPPQYLTLSFLYSGMKQQQSSLFFRWVIAVPLSILSLAVTSSPIVRVLSIMNVLCGIISVYLSQKQKSVIMKSL